MSKVLVIAEIGVNHNGDLKIAEKLIESAASAGANIVKFQAYIAGDLATSKAKQANYQKKNSKEYQSQKEMLLKFQFDKKNFQYIKDCCVSNNVEFLATAFDFKSLDMLSSFDLQRIKIPSGEITNYPYLQIIGGLKKPIILSTGMSTLEEINSALRILEKSGAKRNDITILHCTSEYPAPLEEVNLNVLKTLSNEFGTKVGYSDHTNGIEVSIAAVALGAKVIEKHLTLNRNSEGPDHLASIEPLEFKMMTQYIRNVEVSLGSYFKKPTVSETKNRIVVRKSLVALRDIKKGEKFSHYNLTSKRPGDGVSPMEWTAFIGRVSKRN